MTKNINFIISPPRGGAIEFAYQLRFCGIALPHTHLIARSAQVKRIIHSPLNLYNTNDGLARSICTFLFESKSIESIHAAYKLIKELKDPDEVIQLYRKLCPSTSPLYDPSFSLGLYPELIQYIVNKLPRSYIYVCHKDPLLFIDSILTSIYGLDSLILWHKAYRSDDDEFEDFEPILMWLDLEKKIADQINLIQSSYHVKHFYLKRSSIVFLNSATNTMNSLRFASQILPWWRQDLFVKYIFDSQLSKSQSFQRYNAFSHDFAYQAPMSLSGDPQIISKTSISETTHSYLKYLKDTRPHLINDVIDILMHPEYKHFQNSKSLLQRF